MPHHMSTASIPLVAKGLCSRTDFVISNFVPRKKECRQPEHAFKAGWERSGVVKIPADFCVGTHSLGVLT